MSTVRVAEELRIAAALAHALPGTCIELENADGDVLRVGFGNGCRFSPCQLRREMLAAGLGAAPVHGAVCVRLNDAPPSVCHTGLGLYRYRGVESYGYACATMLAPERVETVLRAALADEAVGDPLWDHPFHTLTDEDLGVTLLFTRHDDDSEEELGEAAQRRAQRAAIACLTAELLDDVTAV